MYCQKISGGSVAVLSTLLYGQAGDGTGDINISETESEMGREFPYFDRISMGSGLKSTDAIPQLWVVEGFRRWVELKATVFPITVLTTCKYPRMDDVLSGWGWFELYNSL